MRDGVLKRAPPRRAVAAQSLDDRDPEQDGERDADVCGERDRIMNSLLAEEEASSASPIGGSIASRFAPA